MEGVEGGDVGFCAVFFCFLRHGGGTGGGMTIDRGRGS